MVKSRHNSKVADTEVVGRVRVVVTPLQFAVMNPPVLLLERELTCRRSVFRAEGATGCQREEETVNLCDFDLKERLAFSAGLLPRLKGLLEANGYRVDVKDQRFDLVGGLDREVLEESDEEERRFIKAVCDEPLGQIEVRSFEETISRLVLLGSVFPRQRFVVAVARRLARKIWNALEEEFVDNVGLRMTHARRKGKRWLVSTLGSLSRRDVKSRDVLLLPCGEDVTGGKAEEVMSRCQFQRIYAFINPQRRHDRLTQFQLEQRAGPVIYRIPHQRASVRVIVVPTPSCKVSTTATPLERKRSLIWRNRKRNERVAAVAWAIVTGAVAALKAFGFVGKDISTVSQLVPEQVAVLVETPEHVRELLPLLPGWSLFQGEGSESKTRDGDVEKSSRGPVIMTSVYAATNVNNVSVLIRATGTEWPLKVKNFPPRSAAENSSPVLLIDFVDEFDSAAAADSKRRREQYLRQGMIDVVQAREKEP